MPLPFELEERLEVEREPEPFDPERAREPEPFDPERERDRLEAELAREPLAVDFARVPDDFARVPPDFA